MSDDGQLNFDDVRAETQRALKQVEENADERWKAEAYEAVVRTAHALSEFISDDVWSVGGLTSTREDRALGPVFLRAKRAGLIEKTGRVLPSRRSHLTGKPVWRSLVGATVPAVPAPPRWTNEDELRLHERSD